MDKKNNFSTRQQSAPHREGQMDNVTPQKDGTGQRVSENKSQAMPDILNNNEEQHRSGQPGEQNQRDQQQKDRAKE